MADLRTRFGRLVAAHRRRAGLTQEALAAAADVSVHMISKIETGATGVRFPVIERLSAALNVDPAELFSAETPAGRRRRPEYAELADRLADLPDDQLHWLSGLVEAALRRRPG